MGLFDMFKGNSAEKELRANGIDPDDSFVLNFGGKEPLKFTDASYKCDVYFTYTGESKLRIEDMGKLNGLTSKEKIAEFMEKIADLLDFLLPLYIEEGKLSLTVAVGCTGGRHRSVAIAAALRDYLKAKGFSAEMVNRDIDK